MMYSLASLCCRVSETSFNHLIHISIQAEENLNGTTLRQGVEKEGQFFFETDARICMCMICGGFARVPLLPRHDLS